MSSDNLVAIERKRFNWRDWFVYFVLGGLIIAFALLNKAFLTPENFESIGRQTAMVSIVAFGMTFIITSGNIDLSVGSIVGLSGLSTAMFLQAGFSIPAASILGILIGTSFGLINGLLVAKVKIPAFLVTLGTMGIARGLALLLTNTKAVIIISDSFASLWGAGSTGVIPTAILWTAVIFAVAFWLYHYTTFGNHVKATGGNRKAALYSGVKIDKITILVFVLGALMASISGLIMAARLKSGRPEVGGGMELDAIAAVILGGTALSGGRGKMVNTLVGSLIMGIIVNGLIIMGVPSNVQQIVKGIIIIAAVSLSEKQKD